MSNNTTKEFAVVIPAYNAALTLGDTLWALQRQTIARERYEVLVVDDGSTDGTAAVAEAFGVRVLFSDHAGPAVARNLGAAATEGALVLFTDADCAPAPDWIERLVAPFSDPAVTGAKGRYVTRQRDPVARLVQLEYEEKYAQLARQRDIDFIDTYSAAYRRDVFLAMGGFDTSFRAASVEDQELSFRLVKAGHTLRFAPDAIVTHRHVSTLRAYARRKFRYGYWKAYLLRHHPERIRGDSHTPKTQLGQMGWLLGLVPVLLLAALLGRRRGGALLGSYLAAGLGLMLPFLWRVVRAEPRLLRRAPLFLLTRAAALDAGLGAGAFAFSGAVRGLNRLSPTEGA